MQTLQRSFPPSVPVNPSKVHAHAGTRGNSLKIEQEKKKTKTGSNKKNLLSLSLSPLSIFAGITIPIAQMTTDCSIYLTVKYAHFFSGAVPLKIEKALLMPCTVNKTTICSNRGAYLRLFAVGRAHI